MQNVLLQPTVYCRYYMASRADTRTCLLDRWTNHVPVCERQSFYCCTCFEAQFQNLIPSLPLVFCQLSNASSHLQTERWSSKGCQITSRPFFPIASSDSAAKLLGSPWVAAPCWSVGKTDSGIMHFQRVKVGTRNNLRKKQRLLNYYF